MGQILGSSLAGGFFGTAHSEIAGYRHAYLAFCGVAFVALILGGDAETATRGAQRVRSKRQPSGRSSVEGHAHADARRRESASAARELQRLHIGPSAGDAIASQAPDASTDELVNLGELAGRPGRHRAGFRRERASAGAAHARSLRQSHRRSALPSRVARPGCDYATRAPGFTERHGRIARRIRTCAAPRSSTCGDRSNPVTDVRSR